ncbi:MAG: alpha/beta fold hydrolase, partial [Deltaproteobacteria bacterium]|nr:alpha/beta fold hydrolase [Kofleriaceae bacterium]
MRALAPGFLLGCLLLVACGPRTASPLPAGPSAEAPKGAPREGTVDGVHYLVAGEGARTIVLVHGNYDSLGTWHELARRLVPHARVVALDLPGYGASENRLDDFSLGGLALGVRAVVDELGANEVVLVGNSLGGAVVARFAASWPERVAGVVLEDANFVDE